MDTSRHARLAQRLPCYYGWVIFGIVMGTNFTSRPLMSVTVLSVFVIPMTEAFGWSRSLFAGAVSLGGICAVLISPLVGRWVDKYGSGVIIGATSAIAGFCAIGLALVRHVAGFYLLYVPGRMSFASPLELATSTALSNWFLRRRAYVLALLSITQGIGLASMTMIAQWMISLWGWQVAWASLGLYTLAAGIVPALLLMVRRPEDMGLEIDPAPSSAVPANLAQTATSSLPIGHTIEHHFTLQEAMQTRAFWVLSGFSAVAFMAQAGISLHHVSHYIQNGVPGHSAAIIASVFGFFQGAAGLMWSGLTRDMPVRGALAITGLFIAMGAAGTAFSTSLFNGVISSSFVGAGIGGLHVLLPFAWASYYGRYHLGAIRGATLPAQIGAQAIGPIAAGAIFDYTGTYMGAFVFFALVVTLGSALVLTARPPRMEPTYP